jgi:hypothetical protein
MGGELVFKGTRISVGHVGALAARAIPVEEILEDYPRLSRDDVGSRSSTIKMVAGVVPGDVSAIAPGSMTARVAGGGWRLSARPPRRKALALSAGLKGPSFCRVFHGNQAR